jgi:hypothetical protein
MTIMSLFITVALALIAGTALARHHRGLPRRLTLALSGGLHAHRDDERGESNISTQLGLTVLGIVLLVAIFAALTGVANQVITFIQQQLGLSS